MEIPIAPINFINPAPLKRKHSVDEYDCFFPKQDQYYQRRPIGFQFSERKIIRTEASYLYVEILNKIYNNIPYALYDIVDEINDSKGILQLEENWDGLGAMQIPQELYVQAIEFLLKYSIYIYGNLKTVIQAPEINPCPNGTIDFSWRTSGARMLINIKKRNDTFLASFYGYHNDNKLPQEGLIDMNKIDDSRALWMKELK